MAASQHKLTLHDADPKKSFLSRPKSQSTLHVYERLSTSEVTSLRGPTPCKHRGRLLRTGEAPNSFKGARCFNGILIINLGATGCWRLPSWLVYCGEEESTSKVSCSWSSHLVQIQVAYNSIHAQGLAFQLGARCVAANVRCMSAQRIS